MKVQIKQLDVEMQLKNKGVELEVRDNDDTYLGDLVVNKTGLTWCKGRTRRTNGKKMTWKKFIKLMSESAS